MGRYWAGSLRSQALGFTFLHWGKVPRSSHNMRKLFNAKTKHLLANFWELSSKWPCVPQTLEIRNSARFFEDLLRQQVFNGRFVSFVKRILFANTTILKILKLVVASLCVLAFKIVNEGLLHCYLLLLLLWHFFLSYPKIYFRLKTPNVVVETFLASNTMVRVEFIKWIHQELISTVQHKSSERKRF